jgi:TM2 domain-containing membrane protein YozV
MIPVLLLLSAGPVAAQVADTLPLAPPLVVLVPDSAPAVPANPSPRGAFLRSVAVPGLGQFYAGAPRRGMVFIALQTTSYAMLAKTMHGLGEARTRERGVATTATDNLWQRAAEDTTLARRLQDPIFLDEQVAADPDVANARGLVRARTRHRQDWITYTLVTTMASGLDAFIAAHLAAFPAEIATELRPGGRASLRFDLPVGGTASRGR